MPYDRTVYFDSVRASLFDGALSQEQVDGQNFILDAWERGPEVVGWDRRWLAYALATTMHETAARMWPIEEYGKGQGQPYGVVDAETGQTYYGRGFVQLTWRENYRRATQELGLSAGNDLEWHAAKALDPKIAAQVMFRGMSEGWFRKSSDGNPHTFMRYFSSAVDDAYGAREIINGDKTVVLSWSGGISIGNLIADYHRDFLSALDAAAAASPRPPAPDVTPIVTIDIRAAGKVTVVVNGVAIDVKPTS